MHLALVYGFYVLLFLGVDIMVIRGFGFNIKPITPTELNMMAFVALYIYNENRKEKRK